MSNIRVAGVSDNSKIPSSPKMKESEARVELHVLSTHIFAVPLNSVITVHSLEQPQLRQGREFTFVATYVLISPVTSLLTFTVRVKSHLIRATLRAAAKFSALVAFKSVVNKKDMKPLQVTTV